MSRIPVAGPWITEKEIAYVAEAARGGWYEDATAPHRRFEEAFARYVGRRHAMTMPSCTSAIHVALLALGVGPGDEVVVPDVTWIASAAPVTYVGATPVFADVDRNTWCLDAASFDACITPRTKAVIPVDLYGGVCDWDALLAVAGRRKIAVLEDAAEAVGAEYHGKKAGAFGEAGVYSFHGTKTLTTGEGGMLVTDRKDLLDRCRVLADHGRVPGDPQFFQREVAHKYKMSGLQAALGLAQLERIDELIDRKREAFGWYRDRLQGLDGVTLNHEPAGTKNAYWMVTAVLDPRLGVRKEALEQAFRAEEIDTRPFFHPLSSLPAYAGTPEAAAARERNRVAYAISPYAINLPSSFRLTEADVDRVCSVLRRALP